MPLQPGIGDDIACAPMHTQSPCCKNHASLFVFAVDESRYATMGACQMRPNLRSVLTVNWGRQALRAVMHPDFTQLCFSPLPLSLPPATSAECLAMPQIVHACIAGTFMLVFVATACLVSMAEADGNPASKRHMAVSHTHIEVKVGTAPEPHAVPCVSMLSMLWLWVGTST